MPGSYANPVVPGDHPDPSVIRVGKTFWAATTSTDWAPCFPVSRSDDLVNWTSVGAVFSERPTWSDGDYWAPELSEYRGRYYVYYVGRRREGPLTVAVASAERPEGPYVDHGPLVGQYDGSIDPMAFVDRNGRRRLIWKEDGNSAGRPTILWSAPLSDDGTALCGEPVEILRNDAPWEHDVVEAPFVLVRDGWHYLFYSGNGCCGLGCRYALGVARARSLEGPWEKSGRNPILESNAAWRCPGHGSIVSLEDGRTYLLYHAYDASASDPRGVGRQTLLDEIVWENDGWPSINDGKGPSSVAASPLGTRLRPPLEHFSTDFRDALDPDWQWPHDAAPSIRCDGDGIVLSPGADTLPGDPIAAAVARRALQQEYIATAILDVATLAPHTHAGLAAYGNAGNVLGIAYRDGEVVIFRRRRGRHAIVASVPAPSTDALRFRMTVSEGPQYEFAFAAGEGAWRKLGGNFHGGYLPPWDAGVRIALVAGGGPHAEARFKSLRVEPFVPNVRFIAPGPAAKAGRLTRFA